MYNGFKPKKSHENDPEILAWVKEANIWATLYSIYDDNKEHMQAAFYNNNLHNVSAETLHQENVNWIGRLGSETVREFGCPELCPYIEKFENRKKGTLSDGSSINIQEELKKLDVQIQEEHDIMQQYFAQANMFMNSIDHLEKRRESLRVQLKEQERNEAETQYLQSYFKIASSREAEQGRFIVFDASGTYVGTVICGPYEKADFRYINELECWLRKWGGYAHSASSFCDRRKAFYDMELREQLKELGWEVDTNGLLKKTQW